MARTYRRTYRTTGLVSSKRVSSARDGPRQVLEMIRSKQFQIPIRPSKDMDKLLKEFHMVTNVSSIQPFQKLRDLHSFYANEAGRAQVTIAEHKARRRDLTRMISIRRTSLVSDDTTRETKWRTELRVQKDKRIRLWNRELDYVESSIDILSALYEAYEKFCFSLSREQTARQGDIEKNIGRHGGT